jgi:hypothetical protein
METILEVKIKSGQRDTRELVPSSDLPKYLESTSWDLDTQSITTIEIQVAGLMQKDFL